MAVPPAPAGPGAPWYTNAAPPEAAAAPSAPPFEEVMAALDQRLEERVATDVTNPFSQASQPSGHASNTRQQQQQQQQGKPPSEATGASPGVQQQSSAPTPGAGSGDAAAAITTTDKDLAAAEAAGKARAARNAVLLRDILGRLQKLPWRRVDVSFKGAAMPTQAHNHILVSRILINYPGVSVGASTAILLPGRTRSAQARQCLPLRSETGQELSFFLFFGASLWMWGRTSAATLHRWSGTWSSRLLRWRA